MSRPASAPARRRRPPRLAVWALTVLGVVALSIGVVDFQHSIRDNGAFRLRAALVGVVLLLLARVASRRTARAPRTGSADRGLR